MSARGEDVIALCLAQLLCDEPGIPINEIATQVVSQAYDDAASVLAALRAAGLVIVPVEPTEAMKWATLDLMHGNDPSETAERAGNVWAAMIRATGLVIEPGWQPISTAPTDGTEVLTWVDVATVPVVHISWFRGREEWDRSGQYCGAWKSFEEWEGWWSYTEGSVTQSKLDGYAAPTHWRPLP